MIPWTGRDAVMRAAAEVLEPRQQAVAPPRK